MGTADDLELVKLKPEDSTRVLLQNKKDRSELSTFIIDTMTTTLLFPFPVFLQLYSPPMYADRACWQEPVDPVQLAGPKL